jgi:hypothetical protein
MLLLESRTVQPGVNDCRPIHYIPDDDDNDDDLSGQSMCSLFSRIAARDAVFRGDKPGICKFEKYKSDLMYTKYTEAMRDIESTTTTTNSPFSNTKLSVIVSKAKQIAYTYGEKMVIFTNGDKTCSKLVTLLNRENITAIQYGGQGQANTSGVNRLYSDPSVEVLVINLMRIKTCVNSVAANHVLYVDIKTNNSMLTNAIAFCRSVGQKTTFTCTLLCRS